MSVPERIGRYRVLGELGHGAMGTVYRARDEGLEREVALKVMIKGGADPAARARFLREARAAAKLQHPNIVVIYELGEHAGAPYMALELLEGIDLQHAIEAGIRPDPRAMLPLVLQMLAGLGHAHEHGIVHRDVKPSNVFLPVGRPAKIMDFGVARLAGTSTTTAGAVTGTPSYMSPEQVSSDEVDGRSDLFSVGLILYELVTGEKAIQGDSIVVTMYKVLHETPDLTRLPQAPEWRRLQSVLARSLQREPDGRYPDAREMSAELLLALADFGGTPDWTAPADQALVPRRKSVAPTPTGPAAGPSTPAAAGRRLEPPASGQPVPLRRRVLFVLPVLGVVAALAAGFWLFMRPSGVPGAGASATPTPAAVTPSPAGADDSPISATPAAPPQKPTPQPSPTAAASPFTEPAPTAEVPPVDVAPPVVSPPSTEAATQIGPRDHLARARESLARKRWAEALAEARAVIEAAPNDADARALAQLAQAELVVDECLRGARAALSRGDRDGALEELRRGFLVRSNDPRLLELHREAVQQ